VDRTAVRRTHPLPEENLSIPRTVAVKGWEGEATIESVEAFFAPFGKVLCVRIFKPREEGKTTSAVAVEFESPELAQSIIEKKPQRDGKDLVYRPQAEFIQEKREKMQASHSEHKGKKRKAQEKDGNADEEKPEEEEHKVAVGVVVHFEGVGDNLNRETLKPLFETFGNIAFLEFSMNAHDGYVRYQAPEEAARAVAEIAEKKPELGGKAFTAKLLQGEEEQEYWKKIKEFKQGKKQKGERGGRGGKGRGGGRGRGNGRQGNRGKGYKGKGKGEDDGEEGGDDKGKGKRKAEDDGEKEEKGKGKEPVRVEAEDKGKGKEPSKAE